MLNLCSVILENLRDENSPAPVAVEHGYFDTGQLLGGQLFTELHVGTNEQVAGSLKKKKLRG